MTWFDGLESPEGKYFNSHAHVERDWRALWEMIFEKHFNSHAHVERDAIWDTMKIKKDISTHTLTWSVTKPFVDYAFIICISTHTLTWSVTIKASDRSS